MKPDRKRLAVLLGVLVVIAVLSFWPSSRSGPAPARAGTSENSRRLAAARTSGWTVDLVPTRISEPGTRGRSDVERNIFGFAPPTPPPTPTPLPPTPTPVPRMGDPGFIGPVPSPPPPTATPIIPPPIPYTAMGLFGPPDKLIVALEDNGRLITARAGDTVDERFIIVKINRESVDFGFVGLPSDITRRVPMSQ